MNGYDIVNAELDIHIDNICILGIGLTPSDVNIVMGVLADRLPNSHLWAVPDVGKVYHHHETARADVFLLRQPGTEEHCRTICGILQRDGLTGHVPLIVLVDELAANDSVDCCLDSGADGVMALSCGPADIASRLAGAVKLGRLEKALTTMKGYCDARHDCSSTMHHAGGNEHVQKSRILESLGTYAAGIAHDFNNLLAVISGYTEYALHYELPEDTPARESLAEVMKASSRGQQIMRQLLSFSRMAGGEHHPLGIGMLVKETLRLVRESMPPDVEVTTDIRMKYGMINANLAQMRQLVLELCAHARDGLDQRPGTINLSLNDLVVDAGRDDAWSEARPGGYVRLVVTGIPRATEDDGQTAGAIGICGPCRPSGITRESLAMVGDIVHSHNGHLRMGNGPGVEIILPKVEGEFTASPTDITSLPHGNATVLVVDSDRDSACLLAKNLAGLGYCTETAFHPRDAFDKVSVSPGNYDLVITAHVMQGMTGTELAQRLHEFRPGLPVILCTAYTERVTPSMTRAGEIGAVCAKPFSLQEISQRVHELLIHDTKGNGYG